MVAAFELTGKSRDEVEEQFGGLYRAFQYGAPPHGGAAFGIDRIVMLLCGAQNLREITLFPMNQQAQDLLMGAPSAGLGQAAARAAPAPERLTRSAVGAAHLGGAASPAKMSFPLKRESIFEKCRSLGIPAQTLRPAWLIFINHPLTRRC